MSKRPKDPLEISIQKLSEETETHEMESERTADLLQHVNNECPLHVYEILPLFIQQVQHPDVLQCIVHILYMMSGDGGFVKCTSF